MDMMSLGCLTEEDVSRLEKWQMEFHPKLDNHLTPWGEKEMTELGMLLQFKYSQQKLLTLMHVDNLISIV